MLDRRFVRNRKERRARAFAGALDDGARFAHGIGDERYPALRDPGLVARDQLDRIAQNLGVVEADVRDHRDFRRDQVRPVELAADTDLDDAGFDPLAREVRKGKLEQCFVVRGPLVLARRTLDRRHHLLEQKGECFLGDRSSIDARTLGHRA